MSQLVHECPTIIPPHLTIFGCRPFAAGFDLYGPSAVTYQRPACGIIAPPVNFILKGNVAPHLAWHCGE